jgi:tetratricopeptide (TPR) repeat protein
MEDERAEVKLAKKSWEDGSKLVGQGKFSEYPDYYAMSYYNLGNAYLNLSQFVEREKNLNRAIGCFKRAVSVWSSDAFHLEP